MIEILIDNRNGNVWNLSEIVSSFSWDTHRVGKPASVDFTLALNSIYQDTSFTLNNGDVVRVKTDEFNIFYGYVFKITEDENSIKVKCYDQLRYLLNKDTYVFSGIETGEVIKRIAEDFNLKVGTLETTGYKIPAMIEDGQTLIDVIEKSNTYTIKNTGNIYMFYDDFGSLSYRDVKKFDVNFYIGDSSLMTSYTFDRDIDSDTYNRIILYKDNGDTGKREIYQFEDSQNISKWGILQYYESVDEEMNEAQINEMLQTLTRLKNKEQVILNLQCVGDLKVRAGMYINIVIDKLGFNSPMLLESVKHSINGLEHTMQLEMRVLS